MKWLLITQMLDTELFCSFCLVSHKSNAAGVPDSVEGECKGSGAGQSHAEE